MHASLRQLSSIRADVAVLVALAAGVFVAIHWSSLNGYFLADDFFVVGDIARAFDQGDLSGYLRTALLHGQDLMGSFYRPFGLLNWLINYALAGPTPTAWRVVNLALHLLNGWLLCRLVLRLVSSKSWAAPAAGFAVALFWLYPLAPEVTAWIAARYDELALAGMLIALERHLASQRWFDRAHIVSLLALVFALGAKESALVAPAFFLLLSAARLRQQPLPWRRLIIQAFRECLPALVLYAAFLLWRYVLLGSVFEIYVGSAPLDHLNPLELIHRAVALAPIVRQPLGDLLPCLLAIIGIALLAGLWIAARAGQMLRLWLMPASGFAVSFLAVLPHFPGSMASGEGARIFFLCGVWLALWIALPFAAITPPRSYRDWSRRAWLGLTLVVVAFACGQARSIQPWSVSGNAMAALRQALADEAQILRTAHASAIVAVPRSWRTALFAVNSEATLLRPPFQREPIDDVLTLYVIPDLGVLPANVLAAQQHRLANSASDLRYFCFDIKTKRLLPLAMPAPSIDAESWRPAWSHAITASFCAESFGQ
ncbi:MAG: hypothetical protein ABI451_04720 [Dokdonella sp.]